MNILFADASNQSSIECIFTGSIGKKRDQWENISDNIDHEIIIIFFLNL